MNQDQQTQSRRSSALLRGFPSRSKPVAREIGPIGAAVRLLAGLLLAGSVVRGEMAVRFAPAAHTLVAWALGLIIFPAIFLAWHWWRIHRDPRPFHVTSPVSYVLGVTLFLALYLTWWYAPAISVTSDAALIFFGGSLVLTAFLGDAGCEILTPSNWLLRRHDQIACALFTPIDYLELRRRRT